MQLQKPEQQIYTHRGKQPKKKETLARTFLKQSKSSMPLSQYLQRTKEEILFDITVFNQYGYARCDLTKENAEWSDPNTALIAKQIELLLTKLHIKHLQFPMFQTEYQKILFSFREWASERFRLTGGLVPLKSVSIAERKIQELLMHYSINQPIRSVIIQVKKQETLIFEKIGGQKQHLYTTKKNTKTEIEAEVNEYFKVGFFEWL